MKKLVCLLCALLLAAFSPALAAVDDYAGFWYLSEMTMEGDTYGIDTAGTRVTLELLGDGTAKQVDRSKDFAMKYGGGNTGVAFALEEDETLSVGKWKETDKNQITLVFDDTKMIFSLVDDQLVFSEDDFGMSFGREELPEEKAEPAQTVVAELESFAGDWEADLAYLDGTCLDAFLYGLDLVVTIEDTTLTVSGFMFDESEYQMQFQDGAMTYTADNSEGSGEEMFPTIKIHMLEDDTLAFEMGENKSMVVTLVRLED